ncbi:MAG TPA: LPS export ABC transporter periplasmic protein LptC, partial [Longimicrobiales bacterium]|nr:LPS export ABC transporter periplasmic protein LptC [Longimicrobiales bacterium]
LRLLFVVAAALLPAFVAACRDDAATPVADESLLSLGDVGVLYGMRSYLHTEGTRSGEVAADSAFEVPDSSQTRLFGMEMTLYYEDGRDRARVRADSAILSQRTEQLTAWGNVVARVLDQGIEVASSELHYDPQGQQIWSDSATVITRDDGSVTRGTAFRSDLVFQNWELTNPVGDVPSDPPGGG